MGGGSTDRGVRACDVHVTIYINAHDHEQVGPRSEENCVEHPSRHADMMKVAKIGVELAVRHGDGTRGAESLEPLLFAHLDLLRPLCAFAHRAGGGKSAGKRRPVERRARVDDPGKQGGAIRGGGGRFRIDADIWQC